jgi:hypothetical protein
LNRIGVFIVGGLFAVGCCWGWADAAGPARERLVYDINPAGFAQFEDHGVVKKDGRDLNLVTFHTRAMGLDDLETIYADPITGLPVIVERDVKIIFSKERLIESYDQIKRRLSIKKYKGGRVVQTYTFNSDGPIHNAVLLPFVLRGVDNPQVGWTATYQFPLKFTVRLVAVETVTVAAGTFKAYHFSSTPHKFDVWISADQRRLPLQIRGTTGISATMKLRTAEPPSPSTP